MSDIKATSVGTADQDAIKSKLLRQYSKKDVVTIEKHLSMSKLQDFKGLDVSSTKRKTYFDDLKTKEDLTYEDIVGSLVNEREIRPEVSAGFKLLGFGALFIIYATIGATTGLYISIIIALGSFVPLAWWYRMVYNSDDIKFLFPYIAEQHNDKILAMDGQSPDSFNSANGANNEITADKAQGDKKEIRKSAFQSSAYRVGTLRLQVKSVKKAEEQNMASENNSSVSQSLPGSKAATTGSGTGTVKADKIIDPKTPDKTVDLSKLHGDFNYSQVLTGPRPITLLLITLCLICLLSTAIYFALMAEPHVFEPCLDYVLDFKSDTLVTQMCSYTNTSDSQDAYLAFLNNFNSITVSTCNANIDNPNVDCDIVNLISDSTTYSNCLHTLMYVHNRCPTSATSAIWFPCDFNSIYEQMYLFSFAVFVVSTILVAFIASSVPSVKSLRAQQQRLLLLPTAQRQLRHDILFESNRIATIIRLKHPFRVLMLICGGLLILIFEGLMFLSSNSRAHSSSTMMVFLKSMWLVVLIHILASAVGILSAFEMLLENVPRCLNLVQIQMAQLTRSLDAITIHVQLDPTKITKLRDWYRVRTFIMKYDQGYLYNSMGGAVSATVFLAVAGSGYTLYQLLKLQYENSQRIDAIKNGSSLISLTLSVFIGLFGIVTSWVYLSYFNRIIRWHKELITTLKHEKADIELSLRQDEINSNYFFDDSLAENRKGAAAKDKKNPTSPQVNYNVYTENMGNGYIDPDLYGFGIDEQPWMQPKYNPASPSVNVTAQISSSPNPALDNPTTNGKIDSIKLKRHHSNAAIAFYQKIIDESTEQYFPPTLFGFEYSPNFFTALKGYVVTAVAAIGYFTYKSFLA